MADIRIIAQKRGCLKIHEMHKSKIKSSIGTKTPNLLTFSNFLRNFELA